MSVPGASNHGLSGTRFVHCACSNGQSDDTIYVPMVPIACPTSILIVALSYQGVATFLACNCLQVGRSGLPAFLDF